MVTVAVLVMMMVVVMVMMSKHLLPSMMQPVFFFPRQLQFSSLRLMVMGEVTLVFWPAEILAKLGSVL